MIIKINSGSLLSGLEKVKPVCSNPVLPICENIYFETRDGYLALMGTNTHQTIITTIDCKSNAGIKVLIPHNEIYNLCKLLPSQDITIEVKGKGIEITSLEGAYNIQQIDDVIHFPQISDVEGVGLRATFETTSFVTKDIQAKTLNFINKDAKEASQHSIAFHFTDENLKVVAHDMTRVSVYTIKVKSTPGIFLAPKEFIQLLSVFTNDGSVSFSMDERVIKASSENTVLISGLVDQPYSEYYRLFRESTLFFTIRKAEFINKLKRAQAFSECLEGGMMLSSGEGKLTTTNKALGKDFIENVDIVDTNINDDYRFGLNFKLTIEALNAFDSEEVKFTMIAFNQPMILVSEDDPDYCHLIGANRYFELLELQ